VTLIDAREPWNEFTWASSTVFAAILLTAFVIDRTLAGRWGKMALAAVLAYSGGALLWFLAGPKWGYFCPEWERPYVGRVMVLGRRSTRHPEQFPRDQAMAEVRELTDRALARHPESAMAWYYRGRCAKTGAERSEAFARALQLDPDNPLVIMTLARGLIDAGEWAGARALYSRLLARDRGCHEVYVALAEVEYQMGDYGAAAAHVRHVLAMYPVAAKPHAYAFLFMIYDAMGDRSQAEASLQAYVARHPHGSMAAYQELADILRQQGEPEKARRVLERAGHGK
jgi:tetratricopeptide (TPR) repeat protein